VRDFLVILNLIDPIFQPQVFPIHISTKWSDFFLSSIPIAFLYFSYKQLKGLNFYFVLMEERKIGMEEGKKSDHSANI